MSTSTKKPGLDKQKAKDIEQALGELNELFGDRLSTNETVRDHHSHDESWHEGRPPDAVCFVSSTEQVSSTLEICTRYKIPVIPFGAATGLEGGTVAHVGWTPGSWCQQNPGNM